MEGKLFGAVPVESLREVLAVARRRRFSRGEVVFHRGDPADTFHWIVSGRFAVRAITPLGDTTLLAIRGPSDTFGELALVDAYNTIRSATVSALEDGETRSIYRADFDSLRVRNPAVNAVLVSLLADEVRRLSTQLSDANYLDAQHRLRKRLGELARTYGGEGKTIPLTQDDIAGYTGISRVTTNKILRDEERRGAITLGRGQIIVNDLVRFGGDRLPTPIWTLT